MHQVIARTWRPQRFSEVIGQRHISQTLQNALRLNRVAHGYVFSGQRGVGKTTMARLLAKALNCQKGPEPQPEPCGECDSCREITLGRAVDVIEIDAASNRGIDAMRELRENVRYAPARDRYKVFIIDEAHQITPEGFNALLKTLEEPPPHVVFILATTELHELPETILSRCQHFSFHASSFAEILGQLETICAAEKVQADPQALAALAAAAGGSLRDALSRLEQAMAAFGTNLEGAAVLRLLGAVPSQLVEEVFTAVESQNREQLLTIVAKLVDEGYQLPHFCSQLVRTVRNLLVAKLAGPQPHLLEASPEEAVRLNGLAEKFSEQDLMRFLDILLHLHQQLRHAMEPRFQTELGLLKLVEAGRLVAIEDLLSRMQADGGLREAAGRASSSSGGPSVPAAGGSSSPSPDRPAGAPKLSPFEQDTFRKNTASLPATETTTKSNEGQLSPAAGTTEMPPPLMQQASVHHTEVPSREQNWAHEVMRHLEERQRFGLASMLEGAQWEFGEGEVRLRMAGAGIAKAMPEQDRASLEMLVSEAMRHKIKLILEDVVASAATATRSRGASKASTKPPAAMDPAVEAKVRKDPEVQEFEQLFGKPVSGIRRWKE
ncbi:MAG: DNA polymerase III subunit gamma/tau [Acidobacteria bacterium]|nr:DNA polymerase III subunit gamma/tau [Acidobacteriota bacterium]